MGRAGPNISMRAPEMNRVIPNRDHYHDSQLVDIRIHAEHEKSAKYMCSEISPPRTVARALARYHINIITKRELTSTVQISLYTHSQSI